MIEIVLVWKETDAILTLKVIKKNEKEEGKNKKKIDLTVPRSWQPSQHPSRKISSHECLECHEILIRHVCSRSCNLQTHHHLHDLQLRWRRDDNHKCTNPFINLMWLAEKNTDKWEGEEKKEEEKKEKRRKDYQE